MEQIFNINGEMYTRKKTTCEDLAGTILPAMFGTTIRGISYEQLTFIKTVVNDGWQLLPGYYGEKTDAGTLLKPNLSWFSFIGFSEDVNGNYTIPHQYVMCVNYNKFEISLYDFNNHIGTFPNYYDMVNCTGNRFAKMVPAYFSGYKHPYVISNVTDFEERGEVFDGEIYKPSNLVYNCMENNKLEVSIDYYRLERL